MEPHERLELAREQLSRAQIAALEPEDRAELTVWSFYALENAVIAAADHLQVPWERTHTSKVTVSRALHQDHGLPDVSSLLVELNERRKSEAYGEIQSLPSMTAAEVVAAAEGFIDVARRLVQGES